MSGSGARRFVSVRALPPVGMLRASVSGLVGGCSLWALVPFPRCWWHCLSFPFFVHSFPLDESFSLVCFRLPWLSGADFFPRVRARSACPFVLRARSSVARALSGLSGPVSGRGRFPTPRFSALFRPVRAFSVLSGILGRVFSEDVFSLWERVTGLSSSCASHGRCAGVPALSCAWCACARSCPPVVAWCACPSALVARGAPSRRSVALRGGRVSVPPRSGRSGRLVARSLAP